MERYMSQFHLYNELRDEVDRLNGLIETMSGAALGERRPDGDT
jgi:hypothetical protein